MISKQVTTTRMELLAKRDQLALAIQGRDIIEQKRIALVQELMKVVDTVIEEASELQNVMDNARQALGIAEGIAGTEVVRSVSMAVRDEFILEITIARLIGVEIPRIEQRQAIRSTLGRGYSIVGVSTAIDEAALAFEAVVETIIRQAEIEMRLKRLVEEIQLTSRRLNALNTVLIPNTRKDITTIEMALSDRERTDNYRLRLAKRLLSRKRGESNSY